MIKGNYSFLAFIFILFFTANNSFALNYNYKAEVDTSKKHYKSLLEQKFYYETELRKGNVPENKKVAYSEKLQEINSEISDYYKQRIAYATPNDSLLNIIHADSIVLDTDEELTSASEPIVYAHEYGENVIGFGVAFLEDRYSTPASIFYERSISERIDVGAFAGYFVEHNVVSSQYYQDNVYYSTKIQNYQFGYVTFGAKALFQLINPAKPMFGINPEKFEIYLTGFLGASIATKPNPYLKNGYYKDEPLKRGLNYGVAPGMRYFIDNTLAVFVEVGYTRTGYLNLGACVRFVNVKNKSKAEAEPTVIEEKSIPAVEEEKAVKKPEPAHKMTSKERANLQKQKQEEMRQKQKEKQDAAKAKSKPKTTPAKGKTTPTNK